MKIWIDFINTPQVNFFEGIVKELRKKGHEIIFTCRDSSNTLDLIQLKGWSFTSINGYTGKNKLFKYILFPLRIIRLFLFIKKKNINVAICQSSFYLPIVSRFLGIKSIYTNDNEHALGNWLGLVFANTVYFPEVLKFYANNKPKIFQKKIRFYPGIKEGIYLKKLDRSSEKSVKHKTVYYRPEPVTAQYYKGPIYQLDGLLIELSNKYNVVIIPRGGDQLKHYNSKKFNNIKVLEKPVSFQEIYRTCDLFIGGGGSMTRELAVLGKKVVSTYGGELLASDLFLIEKGLMIHSSNLSTSKIDDILEHNQNRNQLSDISESILKDGENAQKILLNRIYDYKPY